MAGSGIPIQTAQLLNLVRTSPSFVVVESMDDYRPALRVEQMKEVPANTGAVWIAGTITTAGGTGFEAVQVVSTDDGGELLRCYVWVDGSWVMSSALPDVLGAARTSVFPFAYTLAVPLEVDIFRDDLPRLGSDRLP